MPSSSESVPVAPDAGMSAEELRRKTGLVEVRVYRRLGSTNTRAAELVNVGALRLPAAVVALRQTQGRGRGANIWYSDAGSLTATLVLPAGSAGRYEPELPLRVGLAVRRAVGEFVDARRLHIKWPNDVLADGRKLAGVLCERIRDTVLIGIGMNVSTDLDAAGGDVRARSVSLHELTGRAPPRAQVLVAVIDSVVAALAQADDWLTELNRVHALNGARVRVDAAGAVIAGICRGVDAGGRLLVDDGRTVHALCGGHVVEP